MEYFNIVWACCFIAGYPLTIIGMVMIFVWFKQFEKAYPVVFNLANVSGTSWQKTSQYWGYILSGKYAGLDRSDIRTKCAILRYFFIIYLINFVFVAVGMFVQSPKT